MYVSLKLTFDGEHRRAPLKEVTITGVREVISSLYGWENGYRLSYVDEEGDKIVVASDLEVKECLAISRVPNVLRLTLEKEEEREGQAEKEGKEENKAAGFETLNFSGLALDMALRLYLSKFRLPSEAQEIDRIMEAFAKEYCAQNEGVFPSPDTAYVLSFSLIMLNTDLHNPNVKNKMTKEQFLKSNRGFGLSEEFLGSMYSNIKQNELKKEDKEKKEPERASLFRRARAGVYPYLCGSIGKWAPLQPPEEEKKIDEERAGMMEILVSFGFEEEAVKYVLDTVGNDVEQAVEALSQGSK